MSIPGNGRELWLVRHGETPSSRAQTLAGWVDVPLTEEGQAQASALRDVLAGERFESVWSSDLVRTITTARLAWGEARPDRRLREIHFGDLEGLSWLNLEPAHRQALERFERFTPPGGEPLEEFRTRVLAFVEELAPGRHLLFTHGGVLRLLSREAGHDRFVTTGSLLVVDWEGRRVVRRHDGRGTPPPSAPTPPA
jgi:2,3-bisphosphoglycerate-dependent phosphoglycerate mutase